MDAALSSLIGVPRPLSYAHFDSATVKGALPNLLQNDHIRFLFLQAIATYLEGLRDSIANAAFPDSEHNVPESKAKFDDLDCISKQLREIAFFHFKSDETYNYIRTMLQIPVELEVSDDFFKRGNSSLNKRVELFLLAGWDTYNAPHTQTDITWHSTFALSTSQNHYRSEYDIFCSLPKVISLILLGFDQHIIVDKTLVFDKDAFTHVGHLLDRYYFRMTLTTENPAPESEDGPASAVYALLDSFARYAISTEKVAKRSSGSWETIQELKTKGNQAVKTSKPLALAYYSQALFLDPSNPLLLSNRAAMFQELDSHEDAINDLTKAVEINPAFAVGYARLAFSYLHIGNAYRSVESYVNALKATQGLILPKDIDANNRYHVQRYVEAVKEKTMPYFIINVVQALKIAEGRAIQQGISRMSLNRLQHDIKGLIARYANRGRHPHNASNASNVTGGLPGLGGGESGIPFFFNFPTTENNPIGTFTRTTTTTNNPRSNNNNNNNSPTLNANNVNANTNNANSNNNNNTPTPRTNENGGLPLQNVFERFLQYAMNGTTGPGNGNTPEGTVRMYFNGDVPNVFSPDGNNQNTANRNENASANNNNAQTRTGLASETPTAATTETNGQATPNNTLATGSSVADDPEDIDLDTVDPGPNTASNNVNPSNANEATGATNNFSAANTGTNANTNNNSINNNGGNNAPFGGLGNFFMQTVAPLLQREFRNFNEGGNRNQGTATVITTVQQGNGEPQVFTMRTGGSNPGNTNRFGFGNDNSNIDNNNASANTNVNASATTGRRASETATLGDTTGHRNSEDNNSSTNGAPADDQGPEMDLD